MNRRRSRKPQTQKVPLKWVAEHYPVPFTPGPLAARRSRRTPRQLRLLSAAELRAQVSSS